MSITRPIRRIVFVYRLPVSPKPHQLLRGNVGDWLREERIPAMWSNRLRGWLVREDRVADVVAKAEAAGVTVRMKGIYEAPAPLCLDRPARTSSVREVTVDGQLALLEVGDVA